MLDELTVRCLWQEPQSDSHLPPAVHHMRSRRCWGLRRGLKDGVNVTEISIRSLLHVTETTD